MVTIDPGDLPHLDRHMIEKIARGEELLAAVDLMTPEECLPLGRAILEDPLLSGYGSVTSDESHQSKAAAGIKRSQPTCFEACGDPGNWLTYLKSAGRIEAHFRELFAGPTPMDRFFNHL